MYEYILKIGWFYNITTLTVLFIAEAFYQTVIYFHGFLE